MNYVLWVACSFLQHNFYQSSDFCNPEMDMDARLLCPPVAVGRYLPITTWEESKRELAPPTQNALLELVGCVCVRAKAIHSIKFFWSMPFPLHVCPHSQLL